MIAITDAAFIGFRIARQKPLTLLWWAGFYFLFTLATTVAVVLTIGPDLVAMQNIDPNSTDPMPTLALFGKMMPVFLVLILLSAGYYGIIQAAANRAVLEPDAERNGYLRFGAQEWRQTLLVLLLWLILATVYVVLGVGAALVIGVSAVVNSILAVLLALVLLPAVVFAMIALAVRLSLASPLVFTTGKIDLGAGWRLSKGHFWPMLGTYVLAGLLALVVSLLTLAIFFVIAFISGGMAVVGQVMEPDLSSLANVFTPLQLLYYVFSAIVSAMTTLIWIGPVPDIYRQLTTGGAPAEV